MKILKCQTKIVLLGIFRLGIGKNDWDIWNQHPEICRNAKNCAKQKKSIFGPKMPYLGILGCKFEKVLTYFQLWDQECLIQMFLSCSFKEKLLSYLKSATSNLSFRCFDQYTEF